MPLATSLTIVVCTADLVSSMSHLSAAIYPSSAAVYYALQNGAIRLYFPFLIALIAGLGLTAELDNRFFANTRSRVGVKKRLKQQVIRVVAWTFGVFSGIAFVKVLIAFLVIPRLMPHVINSHVYAATEEAIQALSENQSPLTATLRAGLPIFAITTAVWNGVSASAFALLTVVSVVLIKNRVLAILLPAVIYVGESIWTQLIGLPGASYLGAAIYPAGLQDYPLGQSVLALVGVILVSGIAFAWIVKISTRNQRFA